MADGSWLACTCGHRHDLCLFKGDQWWPCGHRTVSATVIIKSMAIWHMHLANILIIVVLTSWHINFCYRIMVFSVSWKWILIRRVWDGIIIREKYKLQSKNYSELLVEYFRDIFFESATKKISKKIKKEKQWISCKLWHTLNSRRYTKENKKYK